MDKRRVHLIPVLVFALFGWLTSCSQETPPEQTVQPAPPSEEQAPPPTATAQPATPSPGPDAVSPAAESTSEQRNAPAGDVGAGKSIYAKKCATCHGKTGEGNVALAKSLKVEIRDLGSDEVQAKSDKDLEGILSDGTGKMRAVTGLSDADVRDVIAYLHSLAKK